MRGIADATGRDVVDVGCGGGTYSRAWLELGAATVTGVDFSAEMLAAAQEVTADLPPGSIRFVQGDAAATGLPDASADVVFFRAVIHHVPDHDAVAREARRLLRPGGVCIVQDRTAEDVREPGSVRHPRGLILERFPRLLEVELARRPDARELTAALRGAGFGEAGTRSLWETRAVHRSREELLAEIRERRGRSLLHELDDAELDALVEDLRDRLPAGEPITETDRWTLWVAR